MRLLKKKSPIKSLGRQPIFPLAIISTDIVASRSKSSWHMAPVKTSWNYKPLAVQTNQNDLFFLRKNTGFKNIYYIMYIKNCFNGKIDLSYFDDKTKMCTAAKEYTIIPW